MSTLKKFMVFGIVQGGTERDVRFVSIEVGEDKSQRTKIYGAALKAAQDANFFPIIAVSEDDPGYKKAREAKVLVHVHRGAAETYADEHIQVVTYDDDNPPEDRELIPVSFKALMESAGINDCVFEPEAPAEVN
ncbi:MAG: hypothetical protein ACTS9Y_00515 [Methylophilus sp.]|uniref:hypothetical protein n=1 Tax=Methylophilus sp. TaxID=29541 RepID=UPI003FA0F112